MTSAIPKPTSKAEDFLYRSPRGASLMEVRTATIQLRRVLVEENVSQLDISRIEIVVAEILNNIVKHAQRELEKGWFEVQCTFLHDEFRFVCRDNGVPMPGGTPPDGSFPDIDRPLGELPEGGWGWSLVRALTTNLSYVRVQNINLVSFDITRSSATLRR